ncbi:ead/Ea22-like family protein [Escherichia marmotae]|uniref:ead/Ea22-like family protein n=1 Tax=Escherichia marmotae TaxID=1499973 RepID=UPI002FE07515
MSNIDKRALREAADAANETSWGRWESYHPHKGARGYEVKVGVKAIAQHCLKVDSVFIAAANPATVLALLDELEAKDSTISTQQQEIRTLLNALEQATEKRNSDIPGQKRLIGWRASDYTDETSDPELAKNWAAAIGVLPIFEGDVNTKLSAAGIGKGE